MKRMVSLWSVLALLAGSFAMVGCQTMHGLGEDISSGGKALSSAAEPSKKKQTQKQTTSSSSTSTSTSST
jgi:predicted small secreted protein